MFIPLCTVLIVFFVFNTELRSLPFFNIVRLLVFGGGCVFAVCAWMALVYEYPLRSVNRPENPWQKLFILYILYWIILFIIASVIDSQFAGGDQYFLIILAKGIDLFPLASIAFIGILSIIHREWAIRNKWLLIVQILFWIIASIFTLYFNHP